MDPPAPGPSQIPGSVRCRATNFSASAPSPPAGRSRKKSSAAGTDTFARPSVRPSRDPAPRRRSRTVGSLADALGRVSAFNVSATRTVFAKHVETPCQALGDATRTRTAGGDPSLVPHAAAHRQNTVKGALRQKHRLFEQPRRTRTSSKRPVLSLEADLHR